MYVSGFFWELATIIDIWKVPMKWINSTFRRLYYYACQKHCIMLGICSYAACIVLCSKLCWGNLTRPRSGWLLAMGTLSQSSVLPWWIRMILVTNYLALVTPLHNIYSRTALVVQLNIQPLSLRTNILNFCSCTVSTPFVCVCVCVCVCVTLTVWVSLIFDQLSGFCHSLHVHC